MWLMSRLTFLQYIFFLLCFCLQDFIKIVRLLLAAVSIIGLTYSSLRVTLEKCQCGAIAHLKLIAE